MKTTIIIGLCILVPLLYISLKDVYLHWKHERELNKVLHWWNTQTMECRFAYRDIWFPHKCYMEITNEDILFIYKQLKHK